MGTSVRVSTIKIKLKNRNWNLGLIEVKLINLIESRDKRKSKW